MTDLQPFDVISYMAEHKIAICAQATLLQSRTIEDIL